MEVKLNPKCQY